MSILLCLVIAIHDGDTMKVQCEGRKTAISVRLQGIDAPEVKSVVFGKKIDQQPFGKEAADNLKAMCPIGSQAKVHRDKLDRYGRTLAAVECTRSLGYVSEAQALAGMAWSYLPPKRSEIPSLEAEAKAAHRGIWSQTNPISPSQWRQGKR